MRTKKKTMMKTTIMFKMMLLIQKQMRTTIKNSVVIRGTDGWQTRIEGRCPSRTLHIDQIHISLYIVLH